jgi:uncharacterized C2H2 Zn-finger protein
MKIKNAFPFFLFLLILIILSCDTNGNVLITSGYPFSTVVQIEAEYGYNKGLHKQSVKFYPEKVWYPAARDYAYNYITKIKIETEDGVFLAEYSPEYIMRIRNAYIRRKNQSHLWIFTEKGLFFISDEINKRFKNDLGGFYRYYQSDEAVEELEEALRNYKE